MVAGTNVDITAIEGSISLITRNAPEYKFRTVICRELLDKDDIIDIGKWLDGADYYELKGYWDSPRGRNYKNLTAYTHEEMVEMQEAVKPYFGKVTLLEGRRGVGGS